MSSKEAQNNSTEMPRRTRASQQVCKEREWARKAKGRSQKLKASQT